MNPSGSYKEEVQNGKTSSRSETKNSTPPERTVCKNARVAPLYFLLYSAVQNFSSVLSQGASEAFAAASSSVKGRRVSPSRSFAGHQVGRGCVRKERWAIGCRRALEDGPSSFLEVAITFAPKNRRISASGFRCECETDNSLKHSSGSERERPFPFELAAGLARYVSRYLLWIIIRENGTKRKQLTCWIAHPVPGQNHHPLPFLLSLSVSSVLSAPFSRFQLVKTR